MDGTVVYEERTRRHFPIKAVQHNGVHGAFSRTWRDLLLSLQSCRETRLYAAEQHDPKSENAHINSLCWIYGDSITVRQSPPMLPGGKIHSAGGRNRSGETRNPSPYTLLLARFPEYTTARSRWH